MKFRDMPIDDIIVIGPATRKIFRNEIIELHEKYVVVDLQYSVTRSKWGEVFHYALVLVSNPDEEDEDEEE